MIELRARSVDDTRAIAAAIASLARAGDLIVLAGEMGAGKTAFAQGFARQLGVHEPVTSPTYTLVHTYPAVRSGVSGNANHVTLHHADLYRLDHTAEVADLALDELLEDDAIVLVEWGDKVDLGAHLQVQIRADDDDEDDAADDAAGDAEGRGDGSTGSREITITSSDLRWDGRWDRLAGALHRWAA